MARGQRQSKSNQCQQSIEHYMNKSKNLSDTLMPKNSTTTQTTKRTNDERNPSNDTRVKKSQSRKKSVIQVKQVVYQATQKQKQILTIHWIIN